MEKQSNNAAIHASDVVEKAKKAIYLRADNRDILPGLATGLYDLDAMTAGWQLGHFNIVAARPAMGKTTFLLGLADGMSVEQGIPTVFFSFNQSSASLMCNFFSQHAKIDSNRLRTGHLHAGDIGTLEDAMTAIAAAPLHFVENADSVAIIEEKCRELAASDSGLKAVLIDDIDALYKYCTEPQSDICQRLKQLARDLNVSVIITSQLSHRVDARKNKRPMHCDLPRQLTDIFVADLVMFIYRDEYYEPESESRGQAEFIIAKQRGGPIGTVDLRYQGSIMKFSPMALHWG